MPTTPNTAKAPAGRWVRAHWRAAPHRSRSGLWMALALALATTCAAQDRIGPLRPGMTAAEVEAALGAPTDRSPQPGCPGEAPQVFWDYGERGLILILTGVGEAARLTTISSFGERGPALLRGRDTNDPIAIGAVIERVRAALPEVNDFDGPIVELVGEGTTLSVSLSGIAPRRVTRLELTDAPAKHYDEGDDCGDAAATDAADPGARPAAPRTTRRVNR